LDPDIAIIAPWREWELKSRDQEIDYAAAHHIPIPVSHDDDYSMDRNMWHLSHEGSDLEDPWNAPQDKMFKVTCTPETAPDKDEFVELEFKEGVPVAVNGEALSPAQIVDKLNEIGIRNGVGISDIVENRLVGMKSRGVYETPAGSLIYYAHNELENLCLDKDTYHYKEGLALKYAELVYDGKWFCALREAMDAFVNETQKTVTGTVRLKLYKGNIISAGAKSPYSLYSQEYVTFGEDQVYDQSDATGFINLFGLPLAVRAMMKKGTLK
jgi:argininosuccinate synthase